MYATVRSYTSNLSNLFSSKKPKWVQVFEMKDILSRITSYLSLEDIRGCRRLNKQMNGLMISALESSSAYVFLGTSSLKADGKEGFRIHFKKMRLRNITEIDELQKMLAMKKMDSTNIEELEMVDCVISWVDTLRVLYNFENLHSLKIVARSERFLTLDGSDATKWELFRISDANVLQGLPLDLLKQKQRKLSKFVHESYFIHYSAVLLRILPLKYSQLDELSLSIGSHEKIQTDYKSIPYLFSSLASCLMKSSPTLKKLAVETYPSLDGIEKSQRMFFKEFTRAIAPMIKSPLQAITDMALNFPSPNFEIDENRNRLKKFLSTLTTLRNISIGQVQMRLFMEDLILKIVPPQVNCKYSGIYLFERVPRTLVVNNRSYSDVTLVLSRVLENTTQEYNFKNYHPLESINFKKTMIYEALPFLSKLHIDQNEQLIEKKLMLHIQDTEMQLIINRGTSLTSLSLKCNLSLLTDSGLTGLSKKICEKILLETKDNTNPEKRTLNDQEILGRPKSKAGLGVSLASLTKLESLLLHDAGENVTDTFALILCQMNNLKSITVTSPSLTQFGLDAITSKLDGENCRAVWHS